MFRPIAWLCLLAFLIVGTCMLCVPVCVCVYVLGTEPYLRGETDTLDTSMASCRKEAEASACSHPYFAHMVHLLAPRLPFNGVCLCVVLVLALQSYSAVWRSC